MRTAGRVNVMIAAVEPVGRGVDPPLQLHADLDLAPGRDGEGPFEQPVFWTAAVVHGELARRQKDDVAIVAVDLLLEEEVRRQAPRLLRMDVPGPVAEGEPADRRCAIVIADRQLDG